MLQFASAILTVCVFQAASAPVVDVNAATTQIAAFTNAINDKDYPKAESEVAPLVAKYVELGNAITAADAAKDAASRDLATECRKARRQLVEIFTRVVKEPRAPAKLQQKVLTTFGVQPEEGEKLALTALGLAHITEQPKSQAGAIQALGILRRSKYIETFEKLLRDSHAEVVNAAAHAMGEYFGEKEEMRKRIVGKLILAYSAQGPPANIGNGSGRSASDLTLEVRHEYQTALARLTGGVHFDRARLWADWYRDEKDAKWKDGVDKVSIPLDGIQPGGYPSKPEKH